METSTLKSTSTDVDKVAAMSTLTKPSVHLQLTDPTLARTTDSTATDNGNKNDSNGQDNDNDDDEKNKPTTAAVQQKKPSFVTVHTYRDASTNLTWKGLNVSKRKFLAYLQYRGVIHSNKVDASSTFHGIIETVQQQMLESTTVANAAAPDETSTDSPRSAELIVNMDGAVFDSTNEEQHKQQRIKELDDVRLEWRMLWKSGRLVTDRTELLTVYPSDDTTTATDKNKPSNDQETEAQLRKRGGFDDLLHMYTDRMWAYVKDEANLETCGKAMGVDHRLLAPLGLVEWLESAYGKTETRELCPDKLHALSTEEEQLAKLKHFLEWFRSIFPYFYDRCDSCGASYKDDNAAAVAAASAAEALPSSSTNKDSEESLPPSETPENTENVDNDESEEVATVEEHDEADHQSFVGYIYPDESEVKGLASRTELYQCHVCNHFTRFPRYNSANHIIQSRRGRCGEYSMLLFRILRALRHETRWVVDWSDHVWAEIWLAKQGRWIHLDPCEAAVDENYLYQGWGKQQTFILAFYLPLIAATSTLSTESSLDESGVIHAGNGESSREEFPLIEDMTQSYTREEWSEVCKRREESESHVQACIEKAIHKLQEKKLQLATITTRINAHPQLSTLQQQQ